MCSRGYGNIAIRRIPQKSIVRDPGDRLPCGGRPTGRSAASIISNSLSVRRCIHGPFDQPPRPAGPQRRQRSLQPLSRLRAGREPTVQPTAAVTRHILAAVPDGWRFTTTAGTGFGATPGSPRFGGDRFTAFALKSHRHFTP